MSLTIIWTNCKVHLIQYDYAVILVRKTRKYSVRKIVNYIYYSGSNRISTKLDKSEGRIWGGVPAPGIISITRPRSFVEARHILNALFASLDFLRASH